MKPEIKEINAVNDQIGSPTYAKDLVAGIKELIKHDSRGTYHIANTGTASRFDVAKKIVDLVRPNVKVNSVPSSFFNLDANRPINETLSSKTNLMGPWNRAVEDYVKSEWADTLAK
jgi:dTDP-4-dehydrorhamnose reductase